MKLAGLTYFVQVFGCQMNEHDAERIAGVLEAEGATHEARGIEYADICVFLTCSVREKADTHVVARAQALKSVEAPASGTRTICVGGCVAQRAGVNLATDIPVVNVVFGTQAIAELPNLIAEARSTNKLAVNVDEPNNAFASDLPGVPASKYQAWLPIMSGCNNFCSYCIVPYVRGRERSRSFASITEDARQLKERGVKEVTLLGQNVNSYAGDNGERFSDVLHAVAKTGIERIRFTSSHPKDLDESIMDAMASHENIMPALHLAVQSGSDAVLKRMNRHYSAKHYVDIATKLRERIPNIALSTDLIVGFPGETDADFEETLALVREANFSSAYTFIYSRRPGTVAAKWDLGYTKEEVHNRFDRLVELVSQQAYRFNQRFVDTVVHVLLEGESKKDASLLTGHSEHNICVHVPKNDGITPGMIVPVKIQEAKTWYLTGDVHG